MPTHAQALLSGLIMRLTNIVFLCVALAGAGASAQADEVDVLIVGGGATGAYAAVRIREDFNKTVLVVEKADRMVSIFFISWAVTMPHFNLDD